MDGYKKEASHYVSEHVIKEDRKKHNYNKIKYFFENPGQTILIYNPGNYYWVYARILDETLSKILFVEIRLYVERDETLTELAYSYLVLSPLGGKFEYYF